MTHATGDPLRELPGLETTLTALRDGVRVALGDDLLGLYVSGSLVMGDFEPASSDIDFLAVTSAPPADTAVSRLAALHARLPDPWGARLEGEYASLLQFSPAGIDGGCLSVGLGRSLRVDAVGEFTAENLAAMRDRSITLVGPHPRSLLPAVDAATLAAAFRAYLGELQARLFEVDAAGAAIPIERLAAAALNVARCLYGLQSGHIATKREGAAWLAREAPDLEPALIAALDVRRGARDATSAGNLCGGLPALRRRAVTGAHFV